MILSTTSELPQHEVLGIVTAQVACIKDRIQFDFDQKKMDQLSRSLKEKALLLGANAVIGITIELQSPVIHGSIKHNMTAFGTAIKTSG